MLPSRFWFSNVVVHRVLRSYRRPVSIWSQPPGPEWSDWLVLDCSTDVSGIASRATYAQLLDYFRPSRLHGALTGAHYSPWRAPELLSSALPGALRGLLLETMPGLCSTTLGCPTTAAIYGGMAGVSILSRSCCSVLVSPSAPAQGSDPLVLSQKVLLSQQSSAADESPLALPVEEVSISSFHAPVGQDSPVAPVLVPHGSLCSACPAVHSHWRTFRPRALPTVSSPPQANLISVALFRFLLLRQILPSVLVHPSASGRPPWPASVPIPNGTPPF